MENNWRDFAENLLNKELADDKLNSGLTGEVVDVILQCMNLVFEATKKECADKAELYELDYTDEGNIISPVAIDKDSILNINKPNI